MRNQLLSGGLRRHRRLAAPGARLTAPRLVGRDVTEAAAAGEAAEDAVVSGEACFPAAAALCSHTASLSPGWPLYPPCHVPASAKPGRRHICHRELPSALTTHLHPGVCLKYN